MATSPIRPRSPASPPPHGAGGGVVAADSADDSRAPSARQTRDDDGPQPLNANQRPRLDASSSAPRRSLESALVAERMAKLRRGPYEANHGISGVELNGKVTVHSGVDPATGDDTANDKTVMCRHLALWFTKAAKKAELMQDFSSTAGVRKHFDGGLAVAEAAFASSIVDVAASAKHVVSSERLGEYLAAVAQALDQTKRHEGPTEADSLLVTPTHVMAVNVARKSKSGVDYFAAKVYDPNNTSSYMRVEVQRPEQLEQRRLADMVLGGQPIVDVYGSPDKPGAPVPMAAICLTDGLKPLIDRTRTQATAENMHLALDIGANDDIREMAQAAGAMSPEGRWQLLQARATQSGVPGNLIALRRGASETVKEYAKVVLNSGLTEDRQCSLLAAKDHQGIPGLAFALLGHHAETVAAFAEAVLHSALPPQRQVELLAAKLSDDTPALALALAHGHVETVGKFADAVLNSSLATDRKVSLLAAKNSAGVPGAALAIRFGHAEAVAAFSDAVLNSALPIERQIELLSAALTSVTPGPS